MSPRTGYDGEWLSGPTYSMNGNYHHGTLREYPQQWFRRYRNRMEDLVNPYPRRPPPELSTAQCPPGTVDRQPPTENWMSAWKSQAMLMRLARGRDYPPDRKRKFELLSIAQMSHSQKALRVR